MPLLRIHTEDGARDFPFTPGPSLRDIMTAVGMPVRSECGGAGSCGLCLVCIEAGDVHPPTIQEIRRLRPEQLHQGGRLACQIMPRKDIALTIIAPPLSPVWQNIPADDLKRYIPIPNSPEAAGCTPLGVAVDLGTTHIRLTLWDLSRGVRLAGRSGLNPQSSFGSDVMTRLMTACTSPKDADEMGRIARDAVGHALFNIAADTRCRLPEIGRVAIVANTAMLALLSGRNCGLLLKPTSWTSDIDCRPIETVSWRNQWGIDPHATVEVVQPLAGFIGSDLLAGVLATRLTEEKQGALLIDFGTNSEIALWDGETLWTTSAAGGPAFEGCGTSCGMPAAPGAIYRILSRGTTTGFRSEVIGGGEATGICGSGFVDVIATLRKTGRLNGTGRFIGDVDNQGVPIMEGRADLMLKKRDIDGFQRAKAAIGAGTKCLMERAGMRPGDLGRICVCGAFGRFLHVPNAQAIGLLPEGPAERFELCGNSALAGCEHLLFLPNSEASMLALKEKARIINLAQVPEFEELFIENLYLRPLLINS